jgi:folate-binding protein YgfZ
MTYYSPLPDRAVLAVFGEDARDFLQGLITKDIKKAGANHAVFAALLSPQGRFLHDFFITEHDGKLLLETDRERLPDLIKRLTMYRLRSKVQFETLDMPVTAVWGKGVQEGYADPRLPSLGARVLGAPPVATQADYDHHRLSLAVPEGNKDLIIDRSIILEYGYDELGAVDFDKGCYVGQEVTARSKHRATLRKFIHAVQADAALPPKGTPVMAGAREAGLMASSSGALGLAHLRVEEVQRAARENIPLTALGVTLKASLPSWCRTSFAEGISAPV